ncbi:hypothetical protein [Dethiothermospora halolimnae]|uniref:hypothetical protein n=1 Tax=Dethiothermospora halolimnae TaxID=3114390 RepID=UPI003CCC1794
MKKRKEVATGVFLILAGVVIFLLNLNVLSHYIVLLGISVGAFLAYYYKRRMGFLITGLITLALAVTNIVDKYVDTSVDISGFLFLLALGLVFLALYYMKNIKGFIYPGCFLPAIAVSTLLDEIYVMDKQWPLFLFLGLSFYLIYLIEYRKSDSRWPIIPGTILIIISGLFFLSSEEIVDVKFWKAISIIGPGILILIGIKIIYNNTKTKDF